MGEIHFPILNKKIIAVCAPTSSAAADSIKLIASKELIPLCDRSPFEAGKEYEHSSQYFSFANQFEYTRPLRKSEKLVLRQQLHCRR